MSVIQSLMLRHDRQWYIVERWQEYAGEARANLLRIIAIGGFYSVELLNYHGLPLGLLEMKRAAGVDQKFHLAITSLAAAWAMVALGVLLCLRRRIFPDSLKFVTTACDLTLLTAILAIADGPKSALVVAYFLVVALAALRFNLQLVWFATLGSMAGYLFLLGYAKWFADPARNIRIERYQQLIFLLALGLTGIVMGQIIRRVRQLAVDFALRVDTGRVEHR